MVGIGLMGFSSYCFYYRASIDLQGVVISRQAGHYDTVYRVYTEYTIQETNGNIVKYRANSNDLELSRDIPIGSDIIKKRWSFAYTIDGREINDFRLKDYVAIGIIGFLLFLIGLISIIRFWAKRH